ncbi:MAG: Smr/MutS family protein [Alphaproteobacteria bacterium]|nr:Smr/MutS family protein [Alphaproteobacteria bacterium]
MSRRTLSEEEKALLSALMQDVQPLEKKKRMVSARQSIPVKSALATSNQQLSTTLDLHGLTLEQAHRRLVVFIEAHVKNGSRELLVITGKGKGGEGALMHEVPRWLTLSDMKAHISMVSKAKPQQGGEGALIVRLRRKK